MSTLDDPSREVRRLGRGPDDLDLLLRNFFRAEMPSPWPGPVPPAETAPGPAAPTRRARPRGRYALAASLLVLLAGQVYLVDRFTADDTAPERGANKTGEATRRNLNGQPRRGQQTPPRLPGHDAGGSGPRDNALERAPRLNR